MIDNETLYLISLILSRTFQLKLLISGGGILHTLGRAEL